MMTNTKGHVRSNSLSLDVYNFNTNLEKKKQFFYLSEGDVCILEASSSNASYLLLIVAITLSVYC